MKAPLRILCQSERGSCAACCGVYNFKDRSPQAEHERLRRRTEAVTAVWPDVEALRRVRDDALAREAPDVLFTGVKVCPFAGYVEPGRVGCLIHPSRHPTGDDLRDLAVYPREVCASHFCAPHDWLRPREMDLAQTATGTRYGRVVTDAGLVKALSRLIDDALGRTFSAADLARADTAIAALWQLCFEWPYTDDDPARFGGFVFVGNDAVERTIPSCCAGVALPVTASARTVLDALGTRALDATSLPAALSLLHATINDVAVAMQSDPQHAA